MARNLEYHDDEILESVPLTPEDVHWILEASPKKTFKKEDKLKHFLKRVLATTQEVRTLKTNFESEIRRRSDLNASTVGIAGTLSPLEAAKFLSSQQLETLFDTYSQQRLSILETQRIAAKNEAENWRRGREATIGALTDILETLENSKATNGSLENALNEITEVREWLKALPTTEDPDATRTGVV